MGREFMTLFDDWASSYDDTIDGADVEYKEVFKHYDIILEEVANRARGNVIEFGVGTGNLSSKIMNKGKKLIGIEPSKAMQDVVKKKYPQLQVLDGDFLEFPSIPFSVDTIVSTYAFHHLTDDEKERAIKLYAKLLPPTKGKIVFADTIFATEEDKDKAIKEATDKGFTRLAADLKREYYTTIATLQQIFDNQQFDVEFKRMNKFVWLLIAEKQNLKRSDNE
ncbi:class I SAM-dependent DNA methyltransferase [Oceanobacillus halotolerans]|uniref:class I SAM-dependent DNA methyltransferase n=1 Tax=Oceanobacillus halotolerans TaxID=2663380 RepID=UPI0013D92269|nr:class I SAM-dependent methyltransferase [Oceanobacillus halotolerans]